MLLLLLLPFLLLPLGLVAVVVIVAAPGFRAGKVALVAVYPLRDPSQGASERGEVIVVAAVGSRVVAVAQGAAPRETSGKMADRTRIICQIS